MNIDRLFLQLFTSFVRQTDRKENNAALNGEEWNRLLTLSAYHQIIPIIYESVSRMESFRTNPPAIAGMWKRETMMAVARQIRMTEEFIRLYKEMREYGLEPLVLKGIICRNLYPKPDYRMSTDEDLFLPKGDFWRMNEFLMKKGFSKKETDEELKSGFATLHEVGYRNPQTGVYLEIHLSLFPEESGAYGHFNELFDGLHNNAVSIEVNGCEIRTLDYTEHFLYLLCHSAKHMIHSGFGVRQVFDMVLFAENYGSRINWAEIVRKTKKNHLYVFMMNLFDIGARYMEFDGTKACWPEKAQKMLGTLDSEDLLNDLLTGGVFGASSSERLHSSSITLAAADQEKKKGTLLAALFPERTYMEKKYPYLKKYPWLLPVGWLHRLAEHVRKGRRIDNKKVVTTGNQRIELLKKYKMI